MTYLDFVNSNKKQGHYNDYYNSNAKYDNRFKLHQILHEKSNLNQMPINYLEFGVAKGDMILYWASKNNNPESFFVGFDSFEGLPESWENKDKGHFNTQGNFPKTHDTRVKFVKGWFQDTVYNSLKSLNFNNQSVFHLDADLFSSTIYVLFQLHLYIKEGDILIFDEFSSHEDEFLAFEIFKKSTGREWKYNFLGAVNNYRQVAFQIK